MVDIFDCKLELGSGVGKDVGGGGAITGCCSTTVGGGTDIEEGTGAITVF